MVVLVLELVAGYTNQRRLRGLEPGFRGPDFGRGTLQLMFLCRMALLLAGLGLALYMLGTGNGLGQEHAALLYFLLSLVVLQELAGRLLFYGSYFRVGL